MPRWTNPSFLPVVAFRLTRNGSAVLPLMPVKYPPAMMWPLELVSVSTWPAALWPKAVTTLPVVVSTSAMSFTVVPPTVVNFPPM